MKKVVWSKKKKIFFWCSLIITTFFVTILLIFFINPEYLGLKKTKNKQQNFTPSPKRTLIFYKYEEQKSIGYSCMILEPNGIVNKEMIVTGKYECETNTCTCQTNDSNYAIIVDDILYLYNYKLSMKTKLDIDYTNAYDLDLVILDNKPLGIIRNFGDKTKYISITNKQIQFESKNIITRITDELGQIVSKYDEYLFVDGIIYNMKSGKIVHDYGLATDMEEYLFYSVLNINGKEYHRINKMINENTYKIYVYDADNKLLITCESIEFLDNGNIATIIDKSLNIFDSEGKLIYEGNNKYEQVLLVKNYLAVIDKDNYLKILDYKNNEIVKFIEMTPNYIWHSQLSGLYKENGKYAIYLNVEDKSIEPPKQIRYYYEISTGKTGKLEP